MRLLRRQHGSHRRNRRIPCFESLESRRLLAPAVWNNPFEPTNVNDDGPGTVTPIDALIVIEELINPRYQEPGTGRLPQSVPDGERPPYLDVNCDNFVTPLDVLIVVDDLISEGSYRTGNGVYPSLACSPRLVEGTGFATTIAQSLVLPDDTSAVRVLFRSPQFDTQTRNFVQDAFEIEITDTAGRPLSLPFAPGHDAVVNWSETEPITAGPATTIAPGGADKDWTATVNLNGIPAGTQVVAHVRLVNNDTDDNTSVIVRGFNIVDAPAPPPAGIQSAPATPPSPSAIAFDELADLSSSFPPSYGRTALDGDDDTLTTELTITNTSNFTVTGQLIIAIGGISAPDAHALAPDGFLPDGRPFFDLSPTLPGGRLEPGQSVSTRRLSFLNDGGRRFGYELATLGKLNRAPASFDSTPVDTIEAGRTFRYVARAVDPDEEPLAYSLTVGPEAAAIDPQTGQLTWPTTATDAGNHQITLRATDPDGLFVEQTFTLQVLPSLQNRPPVFVSSPDTEAIAASGFEVSTAAAGDGPAGIALADIGVEARTLVTINPGSQTLALTRPLIHDTYALPVSVPIGEPAPSGDVLRGGFNVNPGLPPYDRTGNTNRIDGFDQGDLDGDGNLDLVSNVWYVLTEPSVAYVRQLVVNYGDGNGGFSDAVVLAELPAHRESYGDYTTLAVADLNGDGALDVLALNTQNQSLDIVIGHGDGRFESVRTQTFAAALASFKIVDLNRDGSLDLLARSGNNRIGWLKGNGDATFAEFEPLAELATGWIVPTHLYAPRLYDAFDLDGDGDLDLALVDNSTTEIVIYMNDGAMSFSEATRLPVRNPSDSSREWATFLELEDYNGDGAADVAVGTYEGGLHFLYGGGVTVYLGTGTGVDFSFQAGSRITQLVPGNQAGNSNPIDIDGDGDLDLVLASVAIGLSGHLPTILINRGDGTFEPTGLAARSTDLGTYLAITEAAAFAAVAGDYNRDGLLDVAFARLNVRGDVPHITVVLADSPGRFAAGTTRWFSQRSNSQYAFYQSGDFNNDGYVDLWAPGFQSVSRTWFGDGSGSYSDDRSVVATPYIGNELLREGFVDDLDRDGNLDVVWIGRGGIQRGPSPRLLVGLGNGDGTFSITFAEGGVGFIGVVRAADFNEDGYTDIATRSHGPQVDVWLYDPDNPGTFIRSQTFPLEGVGPNVTGYFTVLAVDDFDGDGHFDITTVDRDSESGKHLLVTWYGNGDGTFSSPVKEFDFFANPGYTEPHYAEAGDLNEDGLPDIVTYEVYGLTVHLNRGDRSFDLPVYYPGMSVTRSYRGLYLTDIDGDGHLDILFSDSHNATQIGIMRGRGDGTFYPRETYDISGRGNSIAIDDFDNDSRWDLITRNWWGYVTFFGSRPGLSDLVTFDLNGDGNDDVLAVNTDNSRIKWFLGDNLGNLNRQPDLFTDNGPVAIGTADFDGDGTSELFTVNHSGSSVSLFAGSVDAGFARSDLDVGVGPVDGTAGDVTGDGNGDLLVIDDVRNALWIIPGNGDATFAPPVPVPLGDRPADLFLADADGDGNDDALITLPDSRRLMILPGDGAGTFASPVYLALPGTPSDLVAADFNDDGKLDIAVTIEDAGQVAVYFGRGNRQFASPQSIRVGASPASIALDDADGDGRTDLLVANAGDDTVSVVYNRFDPTEIYRYEARAADPDDDPISYSLLEGPGGLILDSATGDIWWTPSADQIGTHPVTLEADDGRGGKATQSFTIDVRPARENHPPLIAGQPETTVAMDDVFVYQVAARDEDRNPLRYRLEEAPAGATLDPTSGELHWAGTEDGAIETDPDFFNGVSIPHSTSLELTDVTLETWFKFDDFRTNGGGQYLINKGNSTQVSYALWYSSSQMGAEIGDGTAEGSVRATFPFVPERDRWYHFAMTFDDAAGELRLYIDGEQVAVTTTDKSIGNYDAPLQIGSPVRFLSPDGTFDNTRIWNVARTAQQIREGMSRQYDNDPSLVADYRYNRWEAQSVVDYSSYGNHGILAGDRWPIRVPGLASDGPGRFVISVEDGRGGYDRRSFDVTFVPPLRGVITGTAYHDANGDGVRQPEERPLEGVVVYADLNGNQFPDPSEPSAVSDAAGDFSLERLLPGDYPLRFSPPAGLAGPAPTVVQVAANRETQIDAAMTELGLGQIRGQVTTAGGTAAARLQVFADLDRNGSLDPGEPRTVTDRRGDYALTGLPAGNYEVRTFPLAGWQVTDPAGGIRNVTLESDTIASGNDFTLAPTTTTAESGLQFLTTPNLSGREDSFEAGTVYRYQALASNWFGSAVQYDMSLAPSGMTVDPATGLVVWRPSRTQVGEHRVVLRARDESGGTALQDFTLRVSAPNTLPVITSTPRRPAYVGIPYIYDVRAQDAESPTLEFSMLAGPASSSIDRQSGRFSWTPTAAEVGTVDFVFGATDEGGRQAVQIFSLDVVTDAPQLTPHDITPFRLTAAAGETYRAFPRATDALGRPIDLLLDSGPSGLQLQNGILQWTPSASDIGTHSLSLMTDDGAGNQQTFSFQLEVNQRITNGAPVIASSPVLFATAGRTYVYDLQVQDPDADALSFELVEGPLGMSLDREQGRLRWIPSEELLGGHPVAVRVTDAYGAEATQEFELRVRRAGGPPVITSIPPSEVAVGRGWLYRVVADDPEMDPLTFSLLAGPAGMTIDPATGQMAWTPASGQTGLQAVAIEVTDGAGGAATQSFAVRVLDGVPNEPPVFTTAPERFGAAGSVYRYQASADDPEGTPVDYALTLAPRGMTMDAGTGLIEWTPAAEDAGKHGVTILATDAGGGVAVQSFELDVLAENTAPQIVSAAPAHAFAGELLRYDVVARDGDLDPIRYELVSGPAGAALDAFGTLSWQTEVADIGSHDFTIRAGDPRGGAAEQSFTLEVTADTVPPRVVINGSGFSLPWNGPLSFFVSATDNVGVEKLEVTVDGRPFPLQANGMGYLEFDEWGLGLHNIVATATDAAGNASQANGAVLFCDPCGDIGGTQGGGVNNPLAAISSPVDAATVTGLVSISGTADIDGFDHYRLLYRRADVEEFTEFFRSGTPVSGGELGVWDTSLLENDEYVIRLEVVDLFGRVAVDDVSVGLSGALKLGNFRLSFTDLTIPVSGIPIQVVRTYDTLRADREGDFGFGWRLEFRDTDLRVGLPESGLEEIGIYTPMRPGVKVYLTLPGEERRGWTLTPEYRVLPGLGDDLVVATPRFTPDPGNTATLSVGSGKLFANERGELFAAGNIPWNPASPDFGGGYTVVTRDGLRYFIDGDSGKLASVTDRNGNTLRFSEGGIESDTGVGIGIERDSAGRITAITDPIGNSVRYGYSAAGDLVSVTDREGNETRYVYDAARAHYLQEVIDPLGRTGAKTEYDAEGRLIRSYALGRGEVTLAFDPSNLVQVMEDPWGRQVVLEYDVQGRLVASTDALGQTTRRRYDDQGFLIALIDPLGGRTVFERDSQGRLLKETKPNGASTLYTYDGNGAVRSVTDAIGNTKTFVRDVNGNLVRSEDAAGVISILRYDDKGRLIEATDAAGLTTRYVYADFAAPVQVERPDGTVVVNRFSANGELVWSALEPTPGGSAIRITETRYDRNGQPIARVIDGVTYESLRYDSSGRLSESRNVLGETTTYAYDSDGRLTGVAYSTGTSAAIGYDDQGRLATFSDVNGRTFTAVFDALDRPTTQFVMDEGGAVHPFQRLEYDALGRVIRTSGGGVEQTGIYDAVGNILEVRNSGDAVVEAYAYDALDRPVRITDANGAVTEFQYDNRNRLSRVALPTGEERAYRYDEAGRLATVIDQTGAKTRFEYDRSGRLAAVIRPDGAQFAYEYDARGGLRRVTDAQGHVVQWNFDEQGRIGEILAPNGNRQVIVYNDAGLPVSWRDGDASTVQYNYDDRLRMTEKVYPDGSRYTYEYDANDRIVRATGPLGTFVYGYDPRGRLVSRTQPDGSIVTYEYDAEDRVSAVTTREGTVRYAYDARGMITQVTGPLGRVTRYGYGADGVLNRIEHANGLTESRTYDSAGLLQSLRLTDDNGALLRELSIERDAFGRRTAVDRGQLGRTEFVYDSAGRLLEERHAVPGRPERSIRYVYDRDGNRTAKIDSRDGTVLYEYNATDQLVRETREKTGVVKTYTYSAAGNLTGIDIAGAAPGEPTRIEYLWGPERRLLAVREWVGGTMQRDVRYGYDPFGILVQRVVDGVEENFLIDTSTGLSRVLGVYDADGNTVSRFLYGIGRTQVIVDGVAYTVHTDTTQTEFAVTDENGSLVADLRFDAFGNRQPPGGSLPFAPMYAGHLFDEDANLYSMRARFMDPTTGRFLSEDLRAGDAFRPETWNRYTYVANDPVSFRDPTGWVGTLAELSTTTKILGGLSALAIAQGGIGAALSAVRGTLEWSGNTYSASTGDLTFGIATMNSEALRGARISATYLTIGIGKSFSLLDFARRRMQSRLDELTEEIRRLDRAPLSQRVLMQNRLQRQSLLGEAIWTSRGLRNLRRLEDATRSPLPFDVAVGDATLLAPALFRNAAALSGFYFTAGFTLTAGKFGVALAPITLAVGWPNAVGASVLLMGFGTGYSLPDLSVTTELEASAGVNAGVSIPIYWKEEIVRG